MKYTCLLLILSLTIVHPITFSHKKNHNHKNLKHKSNNHKNNHKKNKNKKCPPDFPKIVPVSKDVNDHPYKPTAEKNAALGRGAYLKENLSHIKLRLPITVNSLKYDNEDFA
jgi:hypothetical protein